MTSQIRPAVAQVAIVGNEGGIPARAHGFHHRVPAALDLEGGRVVDDGPGIASLDRELREPLGHVERGEGAGSPRDILGPADDIGAEIVEVRLLQSQRLVGRAGDPRLQLAELHGRVAHGAREGLAVNEGLGQRLGPLRRHLDVVAEHVVVAHLEGVDPGLGAVAGLQLADQAPAVVAQLHHLVERLIVAARDHAAVPDAGRRALHQRWLRRSTRLW